MPTKNDSRSPRTLKNINLPRRDSDFNIVYRAAMFALALKLLMAALAQLAREIRAYMAHTHLK